PPRRARRGRLGGAPTPPGPASPAEPGALQLLEETTETAPHATAATSEHLAEQITDAATRRRATAGPAVRQHPEHDRHQRHQHLARPGGATPGARRLALGRATHSLSR